MSEPALIEDEHTAPDAAALEAAPLTSSVGAALLPSRRRRRHHEIHAAKPAPVKSDINVTPLVDVVLVLLIIFMVVTPMLHRGVQLDLPETANHEKKNDTGEQLVVSVRADGVFVDTQKLEGPALEARFKEELKRSSRPVHVRGDKSLKFGDVRKVLDELHDIGAQNIGLGTQDKN